jgi:hypothetical protein
VDDRDDDRSAVEHRAGPTHAGLDEGAVGRRTVVEPRDRRDRAAEDEQHDAEGDQHEKTAAGYGRAGGAGDERCRDENETDQEQQDAATRSAATTGLDGLTARDRSGRLFGHVLLLRDVELGYLRLAGRPVSLLHVAPPSIGPHARTRSSSCWLLIT